MNKIPLLKRSQINIKKTFLEDLNTYSLDNDFLEIVYKNYPNSILDIYSHVLNEGDERLKYFDSEYFRLCHESKYMNFISNCFKENNNKCYVQTSINFNNYDDYIYYSQRLDTIDKYLLLQQLNYLETSDTNELTVYCIEDINLLKMFVKCIIREVVLVDIFFEKKPMLLIGNYDMSLPLVFKNKNDLDYYYKLASKENLYFRLT